MTKPRPRASQKAGVPPGTVVYIGNKGQAPVRITTISYDEETVEEQQNVMPADVESTIGKLGVDWVNIDGIHQIDVVEKLGELFKLHPLVQEDIANADQRPKVEDYEDYIFVVLKMLSQDEKTGRIDSEQVSFVLRTGVLISFQEREGDVFDVVRERIRHARGRIRKMDAGYLLYCLIDAIVDQYFIILENLGQRIENLEDVIYAGDGSDAASLVHLHRVKREVVNLRRSIWPLRELIAVLNRGDSPLIGETTSVYLRDVYDHAIQVIETVELYREMLSGMIDVYLTTSGNRMNEIMKVLTIMASLFIPLTFIAGVYGMNFKYMPELDWPWMYPLVWAVMISVFVGMIMFFKHRKWL